MSKEYGTFVSANEWRVLQESFVAAARAIQSEHPEDAYAEFMKVADQFDKLRARQVWMEARDAAQKAWEEENPRP
ncbi:MAG: hypothetical protein AB7I50_15505 [Vicinamibacterales bacterium]